MPEDQNNLLVNQQLNLEGKLQQKFLGNLMWDVVDFFTFGALEKKSQPAGTREEEKQNVEKERKEMEERLKRDRCDANSTCLAEEEKARQEQLQR